MAEGTIDAATAGLLRGRWWVPRAAFCALLVCCLFSVPGYENMGASNARALRTRWTPIVQMKIDDPLRDMARQFEDRTNEAKRTFRITAPAFAYLTGTGPAASFAFAQAWALVLVCAACRLGARILGSRRDGLVVAVLVSSTYFGTAAFKDVYGWFDSVSYGLLLAAMVVRSPALRAMAIAAACFSDERSLLVAPLTLVAGATTPEARRDLQRRALATALGAGAYVAIRVALTLALDLRVPTDGIDLERARGHLAHLGLALWAPFEGAWILFGCAAWACVRHRDRCGWGPLAGLAYFCAYVASCLLVVDVTRSMSYAFVWLFPVLAASRRAMPRDTLRRVLLAAALLSLLAPNVFIWTIVDFEANVLSHLLASG